jgi:hypothetical protein
MQEGAVVEVEEVEELEEGPLPLEEAVEEVLEEGPLPLEEGPLEEAVEEVSEVVEMFLLLFLFNRDVSQLHQSYQEMLAPTISLQKWSTNISKGSLI